jgi:hypothetical protein
MTTHQISTPGRRIVDKKSDCSLVGSVAYMRRKYSSMKRVRVLCRIICC